MAGQRVQPQRVQPARVHRALAYAWIAVLSVAILGPSLWPGFALSYDLVFTPRQDLLPASIGVGSGLPRAVPQDAVVALVETVIPGSIVEKLVLAAILILVGTGMMRLLASTGAGVIAATVAITNPFVAQRLVIGHWGFLLAYALAPWALVVARRLRRDGDTWDGVRLLLLVAAGSLTPSGSLMLSILAVPPVLAGGSRLSPVRRVLLTAGVAAVWLPWLLPALLHPDSGSADPDGTDVFALRADAPGGEILSALGGGGIWSADVVLTSRGTILSAILVIALLGLAALGAVSLWRGGRAVVAWWALVAVIGLGAALASALVAGPWGAMIEFLPGGGLARDAHKLLGPWILLLAAAAGEGGRRVAGLAQESGPRIAIAAAIAVVPVACQPDLLWGAGGRLVAVDYPDEWSVVRETLATDARPGDVISFPWTSFRRFAWNDDRTMLDPAPRWLPRTTVVADDLMVSTPSGIVVVSGDDPRAERIGAAVVAGEPVGDLLRQLGIGWALVAKGTPGPVPELPGWAPVLSGEDLDLLVAPSGPTDLGPPRHLALVAVVDVAILAGLVAAAGALGLRRVRVRGRPRLVR